MGFFLEIAFHFLLCRVKQDNGDDRSVPATPTPQLRRRAKFEDAGDSPGSDAMQLHRDQSTPSLISGVLLCVVTG